MSRNFRAPHNRFFQLVQRFSYVTLAALILLVVAIVIFAYQVSPLRDPSFQPNSANAGSLIPWAKGISEATWMQGASVLAGLLSTNFVLISWQRSHHKTNTIPRFLRFILWSLFGFVQFIFFHLLFLHFLLAQWLID
jgi:hypothetical protein